MKKNYIMSFLIGIMVFWGCVSYVFGGDEMTKNYLVTINGIEMYNNAAAELLNKIVGEEKELVSVVDKDAGRNLNITENIIKPGVNILIENSKIMERILKLFEEVKKYVTESKNMLGYNKILKSDNVVLMKLNEGYTISDRRNISDEFFLYVNNTFQIIKIRFFRNDSTSEIRNAIPIPE